MTRFVRGYAGGRLYGHHVVREQRRWIPGAASEPAGPGRNDAGLGSEALKPDLLRKLRAVQENFVCELLRHRG
jgi:D-alanyl-D-alanine carboxypeptidase